MQNNNRKVFDNLLSKTKIYLAIIIFLLVIICVQDQRWIVPSIIVYFVIIGYAYYTTIKRQAEISETLQGLTISLDSAAKSSLINSPLPLIILETTGDIIWRSSSFASEFEKVEINSYLDNIIMDIKNEIDKREDKKNRDILKEIEIEQKTYKIVGKFVNSRNKDKKTKNENRYMLILYFIDESEKIRQQKEYKDSKSCISIIMIDNYEETMQQMDAEHKPQVQAEIDKCVYEWADQSNGVVIKSDRDRYVYLFEQRYLAAVKEDKFSILDKIKEINVPDSNQITLSIATSNEGVTDKEKYKSAEAAMDVVLGRGGDQAVIRENGTYKFFGGRAQEVEKRTRVKARVVAHALENLIKEADNVMIMGHKNPDIDAMGSAMGIYRLAKTLNKKAYIVLNKDTASLSSFIKELEKNEEYEDVLINKEVAEENIEKETLIVVVDTHKTNYVDFPELLEKGNKIVVIDHHRRSADYIENATLTFQEVYASSAAELVTEILQYAECGVKLETIEAESLYAGIMMDTKNFTFKTGVRTFEAAAYLRKCGVDIIRVKKWFQTDLTGFNRIADIVKKAEIVKETIGIAINDEKSKDASLICAKAADELLTISDITASFVLGNLDDKVCISGRSIGDINVQIILEKLGGGGHITLAGAQVEGMTTEEAKEKLIECIDEYFEEEIQ